MDFLIKNVMTTTSAGGRARLQGSVSQYIRDANFVNLVQNIDINQPKKFNYSLFAAFNAVEGMKLQVTQWLSS
jgi:hypothetical protein